MEPLQWFLEQHTPAEGRALVVGSRQYMGKIDRRALYSSAIGIDMLEGDGVDIVHDLENPLAENLGTFNHIDCCSVLEHVRRPWLLCANIESVMAPGATLMISVPFIWRVHSYPSDYWRITTEALPVLFPRIAWRQRAYMAGGELYRKSPALTHGGHTFMQKTEVVAFGEIRHADYPAHIC